MKKIELLSPAGDFETLKMAINAHADAVYLSGKNYGARKFAKNFSNEELVDAVKYAHLYGVKIYVTINTIIYESEITDFLNYVLFLHEIGVDAVIMQDIGMIKLVREMLPNLEIHASTQCHVHNNEGLELLKSIGIKRAVLARELSIGEIEKLECDIEKEVFIHGALCLSYSGQCYFSKFHGGRSGNRGECAGVCRLPYQLLENNNIVKTEGNYLLSMRDLCTIDLIKDLIKIGVTSLKIEGRMKSPAYVYYVTKVYRTIIDNYYQNKETLIDETTINNLKVLFNREFTKGYLNNEYGSMVMNIKMPNHQGIHLGEVISYNKKKITIKLDDDVYQNDGIRFSNKEGMIINYLYDDKDNLINHAKKGSIIRLDNKININSKGLVFKTLDSHLINEINNAPDKKIPVSFKVKAKLGNKLEIEITDYANKVNVSLDIITSSINKPTTKKDIEVSLCRVGNTAFKIDNISIDMDDNIFIPISRLNEMRRVLCNKLEDIRSNNKKEVIKKEIVYDRSKTVKTSYLIVKVRNEAQLMYLIDKDVIIVTDYYSLYKKYQYLNHIYYKVPRVTNKLLDYGELNYVVSNLGSLYKYKSDFLISSIYLNITNSYGIRYLQEMGVKLIGMSPEVEDDELENTILNYQKNYQDMPNVSVLVYGRIELMVTKFCHMNMNINRDKKICSLCKDNVYKLKSDSSIYPVITNNCISYILDSKNINKLDRISYYKKIGVNNFIVSLYDEKPGEIDNILNDLRGKMG